MADDWRVTIDFDDEGDGTQLAEWLAAVDLEGEERSTLGDRVIVSRDGPRVYLYSDSEEPAREVLRTVSARIEHEGHSAVTALERWHPVEQAWKDGSIPLPDTAEEIAEEHERLQEREAAESAKTGAAQWEVRIELGTPRGHRGPGRTPRIGGNPGRPPAHLPARRGGERGRRPGSCRAASRRGRATARRSRSSRAAGWSGRSLPGTRSRSSAASAASSGLAEGWPPASGSGRLVRLSYDLIGGRSMEMEPHPTSGGLRLPG